LVFHPSLKTIVKKKKKSTTVGQQLCVGAAIGTAQMRGRCLRIHAQASIKVAISVSELQFIVVVV